MHYESSDGHFQTRATTIVVVTSPRIKKIPCTMCKESLPENATTTTTTYKNSNDSGRLKRCSSISLLPRFRLNTTVKRLVWETGEPMYQTDVWYKQCFKDQFGTSTNKKCNVVTWTLFRSQPYRLIMNEKIITTSKGRT